MNRLMVKVCVCTQCVLNGALEIAEQVEGLENPALQLSFSTAIQLDATRKLCASGSADISPFVIIGDEAIEKATSDAIMAKIIAKASSGETQ